MVANSDRKRQPFMRGVIVFIILSAGVSLAFSNPKGDPARGNELYQLNCIPCHGKEGKGDGPVAKFFSWVQPRNHTDSQYMTTRTDEQFFLTIKEGGPAVYRSIMMPRWSNILSDQDIWDLVAYLRLISSAKPLRSLEKTSGSPQ